MYFGDETDSLSTGTNAGMIGFGNDSGTTGVDSDNEDSVSDWQEVITDDLVDLVSGIDRVDWLISDKDDSSAMDFVLDVKDADLTRG